MDSPDPTQAVSDATILAYMQRQLASGRVKPAVLVPLTKKALAGASHEQIVRCFNQLNSVPRHGPQQHRGRGLIASTPSAVRAIP